MQATVFFALYFYRGIRELLIRDGSVPEFQVHVPVRGFRVPCVNKPVWPVVLSGETRILGPRPRPPGRHVRGHALHGSVTQRSVQIH